jgi:hypothetical protein
MKPNVVPFTFAIRPGKPGVRSADFNYCGT